jgi:hypothetical protein
MTERPAQGCEFSRYALGPAILMVVRRYPLRLGRFHLYPKSPNQCVPEAENTASVRPNATQPVLKAAAERGADASSRIHAPGDGLGAQKAASPIPEPQIAPSNDLSHSPSALPSDDAMASPIPEPQNAASNNLPHSNLPHAASALPPDDAGKPSPGRLLRGAPVYSGPSASSGIIGYAAPGSEIKLVERKYEWARVVDPSTSRQGWIYGEHITLTESLSNLAAATPRSDEAALDENAEDDVLEPKRSVKGKNSRKKHAKKRGRKSLRFVLRFR